MSDKLLIVMVGFPRSGKTTWAREQKVPIVNPDSIRLAIHGKPFIGLAEPLVWATAKIMVRALFLAGHNCVILDATNVTRQRRDDWRSSSWDTQFKHMHTNQDVCRERIMQIDDTERRLGLLGALGKMYAQFEPLGEDETAYFGVPSEL